ncbi:MAG: hypothetical protein ABIR57_13125 [Aeromicrobium sp.]
MPMPMPMPMPSMRCSVPQVIASHAGATTRTTASLFAIQRGLLLEEQSVSRKHEENTA